MENQGTSPRSCSAEDVRSIIVFAGMVLLGSVGGYAIADGLGLRNTVWANTQITSVGALIGGLGAGTAGALLVLRSRDTAFLVRGSGPIIGWPGTRLGAASLVLGPIFLLTGEIVRLGHYYFYPNQLQAMESAQPTILTSYALYTVGLVLMIPAFLALASLIGRERPVWAFWGGTIAVVGSTVRIFQEGISFMGLQLVNAQGLDSAIHAVSDTYGAWYVLETMNGSDNLGWVVLAIGAYRARVLGWMPALAVAFMMTHYSGVLKGTDLNSLTAALLLALAIVPLGIRLWSVRQPLPRAVWWLGVAGISLTVLQYLLVILTGFRPLG